MFYYLYQITNLVNNKIYVGVHKTSDLNDDYMGSGKVIKDAIKKYGIVNFRKDILEFFEDSKTMYAREKEVINDEFLLREDTYNLRRGGTGGFDYINKNKLNGSGFISYNKTDAHRKSAINGYNAGIGKEGFIKPKFKGNEFLGKKHTSETKQKIGEKNSLKQKGNNNSQYGTIWITNDIENKKIKKDDFIPDGWNKGRKINGSEALK